MYYKFGVFLVQFLAWPSIREVFSILQLDLVAYLELQGLLLVIVSLGLLFLLGFYYSGLNVAKRLLELFSNSAS